MMRIIYKLSSFMLSKRQESLYLRSNDHNCGVIWCNSILGRDSERRTESNLTRKREKISIKQLKNRTLPPTQIQKINNTVRQPQPKYIEVTIPKTPKFHFTYVNSNTTVSWGKDEKSVKRTTVVENLEVMVFKQVNEEQVREEQSIAEPTKKESNIEMEVSQVISTKANANHGQDWQRHCKQQNSQPFFSPKKDKFQRGQLFNVVRRSQTILNDYKSDSQQSLVIDDYKSLMSKIHENGAEEEYEEI